MRRVCVTVGLLLVLGGGLVVAQGRGVAQRVAPRSTRLALVGGTLIDGTAAEPLKNSVVLVNGERIERVGTVADLRVPVGYQVVSTEGMTVIPGLWDMHVHLLYAGHTNLQYWHNTYTSRFEREIMPANAAQLLRAGVTSVRDLGAPPDAVFAVKRRTASGEVPGPTIYAAGPQITHEPPEWARFYRWGVAGAADAAAKARRLLEAGADVLKITDAEGMTVDEIRAVTSEAHAKGKLVAAHGRTTAEIKIGLEGGVDEFEHIGVGNTGEEYPADVLALLQARSAAGRAVYWTPTVGLPLSGDALRANAESLDDPANYRGLPPLIASDVKQSLAMFRPQPSPVGVITRKVAQLRSAGVRLLVGTDAGLAGNFHGQALWQELDAWVRVLGVDPLTVLRSATSGSAAALGVTDSGTVAAGKVADIVAVRGDLLRQIALVRSPALVVHRGQLVK